MKKSTEIHGLRWFTPLVLAAATLFSATACSGNDSGSCSSLARSEYSGDTRYVDVTFAEGDFVKGIVGEYVSGEKRTVGHWECTTESGEPVITFYSPAA